MGNLLTTKYIQNGFSVFIGVVITMLLLSVIQYLSSPETKKDIIPLLTVNLTKWPTPAMAKKTTPKNKQVKNKKHELKPQKKSKKNPQKKIKKKVVKKLIKGLKKKPLEKTIKTAELPEVVPVEKTAAKTDKVLPRPVPIYKITETPRFLHKAIPVFPESLKALERTGTVKLSALIDKSGQVRKVSIIKSAGAEFDQAAIDAILASSFIPAKINGQPVAVLLKLPVSFRLM